MSTAPTEPLVPGPDIRPVPRPDSVQQRVLADLETGLGAGGRGVAVLPCGTGKTLIGRWFAQRIHARVTIVVVPSLALIPQTVLAYRTDPSWPHRTMIVCSDDTTGRAVAIDDLHLPRWARESVTVSTSSWAVQYFLQHTTTAGTAALVVSTYHSAPRVAEALRLAHITADLVVCDEAHRLTGRPQPEFRSVLHNHLLPARRRLFLTATMIRNAGGSAQDAGEPDLEPGVIDPLALDDEDTFGPVLAEVTFAEALTTGRVVDYDVYVLATTPTGTPDHQRHATAADAVTTAATDGASRILSFHSRRSRAHRLATTLHGHHLNDGRLIHAEYLDGLHSAAHRQTVLHRLATVPAGQAAVVASVGVLTEGIDVPAIDCAVFGDRRTSQVDIVQAAGRTARAAPGKTRGRIVLAVALDPDLDDHTDLSHGAWRHVWTTLRALTTMDHRFAITLHHAARRARHHNRRSHGPAAGPGLHLNLPTGIDHRAWLLRALDRTGHGWQHHFRLLTHWATQHGHARPDSKTEVDGMAIGRWVWRQQHLYRAGQLNQDQITALTGLPEWAWDAREAAWWRTAHHWRRIHHTLGSADRWSQLARPLPKPTGLPGTAFRYRSLLEFAVDTDTRHRRGELPTHLIAAAQQLPHWTWNLLPTDDTTMIDALIDYGAWKHNLNPPHHYRHDDGLPLGAWLTAIRRRRFTGRLAPRIEAQLDLLNRATGSTTPLRWETQKTGWRLGYLALRQFVHREGHCRIPERHWEHLPDHTLNLTTWCINQRRRYQPARSGAGHHAPLTPKQIAALEQVPGWRWATSSAP